MPFIEFCNKTQSLLNNSSDNKNDEEENIEQEDVTCDALTEEDEKLAKNLLFDLDNMTSKEASMFHSDEMMKQLLDQLKAIEKAPETTTMSVEDEAIISKVLSRKGNRSIGGNKIGAIQVRSGMEQYINKYSEEQKISKDHAVRQLALILCGSEDYRIYPNLNDEYLMFKQQLIRFFLDESKVELLGKASQITVLDDSKDKLINRRTIASKIIFRRVMLQNGFKQELNIPIHLLQRSSKDKLPRKIDIVDCIKKRMKQEGLLKDNNIDQDAILDYISKEPSISQQEPEDAVERKLQDMRSAKIWLAI
jgi:hypothetical protein